MRTPFLVVALLALAGCNGTLPSMQYCSDVSYVRTGNTIVINAKCQAPIQSPAIPGVADVAKAVGL